MSAADPRRNLKSNISENSQPISKNKVTNKSLSHHLLMLRKKNSFFHQNIEMFRKKLFFIDVIFLENSVYCKHICWISRNGAFEIL